MSNPNRTTQQDSYRKIIQAIPVYLANVVAILLAGTSFTPVTLVAFFQKQIELLDDATNAKATLAQKVAAVKANKVSQGAILKAFTNYIKSAFGNQPAALAAFAVTPKTTTPTTNVKALAVAKRAATREARNTMGKRQRELVKGEAPEALAALLDPARMSDPKAAAATPAPAAPVSPPATPSSPVSPQPASANGLTPHS